MTPSTRPADHSERVKRARLSLVGLSVGDAFGGRFNFRTEPGRDLPPSPWSYSDDTIMALSVAEILERHGRIERDDLAALFARRYRADPYRGYGLSVRSVLERIAENEPWSVATRAIYGGTGSMGNGGAMRVAPVGAYFAGDIEQVIDQARASAEVTHAHPEGQAGAIAAALAAAWACQAYGQSGLQPGREMLELARDRTPDGQVRNGLERALALPLDSSVESAVGALGNGSRITAPDTVPFALWCAARHIDNFPEALWTTVSAGGDNDTK